jgi:hypothetical protein
MVGHMAPVAGGAILVGAVAIRLALFLGVAVDLFNSMVMIAFSGTILVNIIMLGPGAFSVDARLFGRRETFIPPLNQSVR